MEKFIWLALPNDEADYLLKILTLLSGEEKDSLLTPIVKRLERQING